MKIIKVSTDLKIEEGDFSEMNYQKQLKIVNKLIGNDCSDYEIVYPVRLYTELGMSNNPDIEPNKSVCMLVDEEGLSKGIDINSRKLSLSNRFAWKSNSRERCICWIDQTRRSSSNICSSG